MLSLESVLGFCHGIAKGGDCKVEFNQPSCWLYFVPNLLVFQQLVTLHLSGILVRVVGEIVWRNAQECARKIETRDWISQVICFFAIGQAMVCFFTSSLLDHIMLASYAFHAFPHTMIMVYSCVSGDSCSYNSRASQFLELGVSELCSTAPNSHVKSRVCFRVLLRNSQRGKL